MANEIDCSRIIVVPCIMPGNTPCPYRMVSTQPADNVWRVEIWCRHWRENNDKSRVLNACDSDFKVKGENHGTETDK